MEEEREKQLQGERPEKELNTAPSGMVIDHLRESDVTSIIN
jgi:hypothetical protein